LLSEHATAPSTLNFRKPLGEGIHLGVGCLFPIGFVILLSSENPASSMSSMNFEIKANVDRGLWNKSSCNAPTND
jgi:hypothetical protein